MGFLFLLLFSPLLCGSRARVDAARTQIRMLEAALETFRIDNGRLPTTEEGLQALVAPPPELRETAQPGGYLVRRSIPVDPWGNPYRYQSPGTHHPDGFDLWSQGADGAPGGTCLDANVGNWKSPPPPLLECPGQHPVVQRAAAAGLGTGLLLSVPLLVVAAWRAVQATRRRRDWRSVVTLRLLAGSGVACTVAFVLLFLTLQHS